MIYHSYALFEHVSAKNQQGVHQHVVGFVGATAGSAAQQALTVGSVLFKKELEPLATVVGKEPE